MKPKRCEGYAEYVPKPWGFEEIICNSKLYCGKKLHIKKDHKTSLHYHLLKDETFYIESGVLHVETYPENDYTLSHREDYILKRGDVFHKARSSVHCLRALEDTVLFEFSTEHFDNDSHRITE